MKKTPSQITQGDTLIIDTFRRKVANVSDCKDGDFIVFFDDGTNQSFAALEQIEVSNFFDIASAAPVTRLRPTLFRGVSID